MAATHDDNAEMQDVPDSEALALFEAFKSSDYVIRGEDYYESSKGTIEKLKEFAKNTGASPEALAQLLEMFKKAPRSPRPWPPVEGKPKKDSWFDGFRLSTTHDNAAAQAKLIRLVEKEFQRAPNEWVYRTTLADAYRSEYKEELPDSIINAALVGTPGLPDNKRIYGITLKRRSG